MNNVFLVNTPLQLLNAIEAKYYFKLDARDCLLIVMGDRKSRFQLLSLVKVVNKEFGRVAVLNDINLFFGGPFHASPFAWGRFFQNLKILKKSFFNIRRLNKIARHLGRVDYIFVGYIRLIYMRHFVNTVPHKTVFLLDDGTVTLVLVKERKQGGVIEYKKNIKARLKLYGKRFVNQVKDKYQDSYNFFTMYNIEPGVNDRVVKNEFVHIRSNLDQRPVSDEIYFLGSPLSEVGYLSQDEYIKYIRRVKKYFKGEEFVYVAHRREAKDKLAMLEQECGLKVVLFDYPIEYQLAYIGNRPKVLASFVSSALDSCQIIFGDKLNIISFKLSLDESTEQKALEGAYDNYAEYVGDSFLIESNY